MHCFHSSNDAVRRRCGFSLIEVVVGLTLMATVLVASLLSFASHRRQRRFADAKLAAVAIADDLLDRLSGLPGGLPASGRGPIPGNRTWFWRTSTVGTIAPAQVPLRVIRFEIIDATAAGSYPSLVTIDLVKALEAG